MSNTKFKMTAKIHYFMGEQDWEGHILAFETDNKGQSWPPLAGGGVRGREGEGRDHGVVWPENSRWEFGVGERGLFVPGLRAGEAVLKVRSKDSGQCPCITLYQRMSRRWLRRAALSVGLQAEEMKSLSLSQPPAHVLLQAAFPAFIPALRLNNGFRFWAAESLQKRLARLRWALCADRPCPTCAAAALGEQIQGAHLWGQEPGDSEEMGRTWCKPESGRLHCLQKRETAEEAGIALLSLKVSLGLQGARENCPSVSVTPGFRWPPKVTQQVRDAIMTVSWEHKLFLNWVLKPSCSFRVQDGRQKAEESLQNRDSPKRVSLLSETAK